MTTPPPNPTSIQNAVPVEIRLYLEAALAQHQRTIQRQLDDAVARLLNQQLITAENVQDLTNNMAALHLRQSDLEAKFNPDERYVLTRQKIIDFMKKAGIN